MKKIEEGKTKTCATRWSAVVAGIANYPEGSRRLMEVGVRKQGLQPNVS